MSAIAVKMSASTSTNPADYDLEESVAIIEHGLGKNAADLFRMSAKPIQNEGLVKKSDLAEFGASIVKEIMKQFIPYLQMGNNTTKQIDFIQDYFTIKGYSNKIGQVLTFSEALNIGRLAGKLSREKGFEIRKADDEKYGYVNSYYIKVLEEVFAL